ncbi:MULTISPECIES: SixA phosphatase family protein [unclassified Schaalia]|uniref:SixA phosphatase family protein n=1 Tax=unclassified Schaalia TaxID=2691889 RepID=UPI001E307F31|nr:MULTISPECIES: hypothetical protein [unclassified Schaalia]MCD4550203.1 hypothetical protein [Schaalia sp. lx-260]MCD4557377.1 hypothetical protein [Schaalia sp. lx-100]
MTMKRTLVLIRHAQAEPFSLNGDHGRVLTSYGHQQSRMLGFSLAHALQEMKQDEAKKEGEKPQVDWVALSDAQRTRETFRGLAPQFDIAHSFSDRSLYSGDIEEILHIARSFTGQTAFIIGHNPTISDVALYLTFPDALVEEHNESVASFQKYASEEIRTHSLNMRRIKALSRYGADLAQAMILRFGGEWKDLRKGICELEIVTYCDLSSSHG